MLVLSVRNYLFPGSQRGPAPGLTLNPVVITLQRPTHLATTTQVVNILNQHPVQTSGGSQ
jgi:hypothetical protein